MTAESAHQGPDDGRAPRERGLTLVEMLVVLVILAAIASMAAELTVKIDDQARFEDTRARLALIRAAVVGHPERTINGEPDVSGFAADVGRLPASLSELVVRPDAVPAFAPSTGCGWRGPYLATPASTSGARAFRDGWQNATDTADELDYGWVLPAGPDLVVVSTGADGALGGEGYAADFPPDQAPLVEPADWVRTFGGPQGEVLSVQLVTASATVPAEQLRLRIFYPSEGAVTSTASQPFDAPVALGGGSSLTTEAQAPFAADAQVPCGARTFVVELASGAPLGTAPPQRVLVAPRGARVPPLRWPVKP